MGLQGDSLLATIHSSHSARYLPRWLNRSKGMVQFTPPVNVSIHALAGEGDDERRPLYLTCVLGGR